MKGGGGDIGMCGVAVSLIISRRVAVNKIPFCGVAVISNLRARGVSDFKPTDKAKSNNLRTLRQC